jgi:hypothetical protein
MSKEKIVDSIYKAYGTDSGILLGIKERGVVEAIVEFTINRLHPATPAATDAKSDAVGVLDWLLGVNVNGINNDEKLKIIMVDGEFYWETDNDGDQPMDAEQLYQRFKKQNP